MELKIVNNPRGQDIPGRMEDFLQWLSTPSVIHLDGEDAGRSRVLVTLSHGNEPSGFRALHRWIREGQKPAVNVVVLLGGIRAARTEPLFYYRHLPDERDLNRCFSPPHEDRQGRLAKAMADYIIKCRPEAVVDMHNTSGASGPFAISIADSPGHQALVGSFVDTMLITNLKVGSLMEQDFGVPAVTIEVGGSKNPASAELAWEGMGRYFLAQDLYASKAYPSILRDPLRLELVPHTRIDYAEKILEGRDVTIRADIEKFNFHLAGRDDILAWVGNGGLEHFRILREGEHIGAAEFFRLEGTKLLPKTPMRLFMATTRVDIAATDCLFYFICQDTISV